LTFLTITNCNTASIWCFRKLKIWRGNIAVWNDRMFVGDDRALGFYKQGN